MQVAPSLFLSIISFFILILSFSLGNVFAAPQLLSCPSCVTIPEDQIEWYKENHPMFIWTDQETYDHNSIITLNGYAKNLLHPVAITVVNPIGNLVRVDQVDVDLNGEFSIQINTQGNLWSKDGPYIITAQTDLDKVFKTQIQLVPDLGGIPQCMATEITTRSDIASWFCIPFEREGKLTSIDGFLNTESKSLTLELVGSSDLVPLVIVLPRYLLDAKTGDVDSDFIVLIDGKQVEYEEIDTSDTFRQLSIISPVSHHNMQIEIIGTTVVPEFGSVAILVLILASAAIVFLSTKTTLAMPIANLKRK